jgi:adenylate cyclase
LWSLALQLAVRPAGAQWTRPELAAEAGMSEDLMARVWRAAGFPDQGPDAKVAGPDDVRVFRGFASAAELFGEDVVLQLTRVIGSSMARLADAALSAFVVNVGPPALADPSGLAMVQANLDAVDLLPPLVETMDQLLRQHMLRAARPIESPGASAAAAGYEVQTLSVGFLDLVGSTALTRELPFAQLGAVIGEFERAATDTVVQHGGRVIKLIGDEIMFTAHDPVVACQAAVDVRSVLNGHPVLRGIRGGIAFGEVLVRDGDCFGPVVNLAARLVKRANRNEVVVDQGAADAVARHQPAGDMVSEHIGEWDLEGFDRPVPVSRLLVAP